MRWIISLCLVACVGCGSFSRAFSQLSRKQPAMNHEDSAAENFSADAVEIPIETPNDKNAVTVAAAISRNRVSPGDDLVLIVRCKTSPPWYIYAADGPDGIGVPTRLELVLPPGIEQAAPWTLPTAKRKMTALGEVAYYNDDLRFSVPLKISESVPLGSPELQCMVHYQACSDATCLAPASKKLVLPLTLQAP